MMIVLMMMAKLMMMINDHDHDHDDHDDVSCVSGVANKVTLPYLHPLAVKGNARGKPLYKENDFIHELFGLPAYRFSISIICGDSTFVVLIVH